MENIKNMIALCINMILLYNKSKLPLGAINKMIWERKLDFWLNKLK